MRRRCPMTTCQAWLRLRGMRCRRNSFDSSSQSRAVIAARRHASEDTRTKPSRDLGPPPEPALAVDAATLLLRVRLAKVLSSASIDASSAANWSSAPSFPLLSRRCSRLILPLVGGEHFSPTLCLFSHVGLLDISFPQNLPFTSLFSLPGPTYCHLGSRGAPMTRR